MADELELGAKIALKWDKEGATAAKKDLRDADKVIRELGETADKTSKKLQRIEQLESLDLLKPEQAKAARRGAQMERVKEVAGGLPGIGPLIRRGGAGAAGLMGVSAGFFVWTMKQELRYLREIAENTKRSVDIAIDPKEALNLRDRIRKATEDLDKEQSAALAESLILAGEQMDMTGPEFAQFLQGTLPRGDRPIDQATRRAILQSFNVPSTFMQLMGRQLPPSGAIPPQDPDFRRPFIEAQEEFEFNRRSTRDLVPANRGIFPRSQMERMRQGMNNWGSMMDGATPAEVNVTNDGINNP